MTTIHIAGPPQFSGLYQECTRCGYVLQDYTGSQPMALEEDAGCGIPYWTEGGRIAERGNATWVVADNARLDDDETECKAVS